MRVSGSYFLDAGIGEVVTVVVADENGVKSREIFKLAGSGREALGPDKAEALLKDRVE